MHRLIVLAFLVAGCARSTSDYAPTFRDTGLSLYSNAVFEPKRIEGTWRQVAAFADGNAPDCPAGGVTFTDYDASLARIHITAQLCLSGKKTRFNGPAALPASGRMQLSGADPQGIGEPWWVVWVDTDYRTLVIGTPSGKFGFILNRGGPLPMDRYGAAVDILKWNGYDTDHLRRD